MSNLDFYQNETACLKKLYDEVYSPEAQARLVKEGRELMEERKKEKSKSERLKGENK